MAREECAYVTKKLTCVLDKCIVRLHDREKIYDPFAVIRPWPVLNRLLLRVVLVLILQIVGKGSFSSKPP